MTGWMPPGARPRPGSVVAAGRQGRLDLDLGAVDQGALGLARIGIELAEALHQFGHLAGLAQVFRFGVFQRGGVLRLAEVGLGRADEFFQGAHACSFPVFIGGRARIKKTGHRSSNLCPVLYAPHEAAR
jgi:hypothetical protein